MLKSLYPVPFNRLWRPTRTARYVCKVNGTDEVYRIIAEGQYVVWQLKGLHEKPRQAFLERRKRYLIDSYSGKA